MTPEAACRSLERRERQMRRVTFIAFGTMVLEVVVGKWTGSLALLADGWHMATHVGALGLASVVSWYSRRAVNAERFAFGPGKLATLAGFTNAIILGLAAVFMVVDAVERLVSPQAVRFAEALPVAVVGLVVNLVSASMLSPEHAEDHHDHNLRSAYFHVLADALTSLLAIGALVVGFFTSAPRLDPMVAIVGASVILWWAAGLLRSSVPELIDVQLPAETMVAALRARLEDDGSTTIKSVTLWPLGSGRRGCQLGLSSTQPRPIEEYRRMVLEVAALDHVAIEIHQTLVDGPCGA